MVKALIAFRIIGSSGGDAKFGYGTRILRVIHGRDARATSHLITHARSCRRKIFLGILSERRAVPGSSFLRQESVFSLTPIHWPLPYALPTPPFAAHRFSLTHFPIPLHPSSS